MLGPSPDERRLGKLAFLRITVIGPSSCGKTSLVNAFVNAVCPERYIPTEKAVVYHKRLVIQDNTSYDDAKIPLMVEVEDTPGSDRGNGDEDADVGENLPGNFPPAALKLSISAELPIDKFLTLGEKPMPPLKTLGERRQYYKDLQVPFRAYDRPVGDPDLDRTLTRNRMGYLLCFDISDEGSDSLKEVMALHLMLTQALEKQNLQRRPYIWLVACKSDKNSSYQSFRETQEKARLWASYEEMPYYETSARNATGIDALFTEMCQAISSRTSLWTLEQDDERGEEEENAENCALQ